MTSQFVSYPVPTNPSTFTLPNGSTLIVSPNSQQQTAVANLTFAVGSHHEEPEVAGISHFFEHMAFKGTTTRSVSDIAEEIADLGGSQNAMTNNERTSYFISGLGRNLPQFIELLYDMIMNSTIPSEELERERQVIIQEFYMRMDEPGIVGWETMNRLCFEGPFAMPTIGTLETINSITREQMIEFRDTHYVAENAILVLSGAVSQEAMDQAVICLSKIPSGNKLPYLQIPQLTNEPTVLQLWEDRGQQQTEVFLQWNVPAWAPKSLVDAYADLLGGGFNSLLFKEVREKRGLVYDIGTYSATSDIDDATLLIGQFATTPKDVVEVMTLITNCFATMAINGVNEGNLQRFKIGDEVAKAQLFDSTGSIARLMLRARTGNIRTEDLIERMNKSQEVSLEDLNRLAEEMAYVQPTVVFIGKVDNITDIFDEEPQDE